MRFDEALKAALLTVTALAGDSPWQVQYAGASDDGDDATPTADRTAAPAPGADRVHLRLNTR